MVSLDPLQGAAGAGVAAPPPAPAATEPEPEAKPVRRGKGGKPAKVGLWAAARSYGPTSGAASEAM